jgi:pilus assembly protein Flp/PilA
MFKAILTVWRDERGATAIEYGLIVALIVIAIIGSMESVANENTGLWANVRTNVETVMDKDEG